MFRLLEAVLSAEFVKVEIPPGNLEVLDQQGI